MCEDTGWAWPTSQWFPLASQQLRLRSLSQVHLFHPTPSHDEEKGELESFYHLTFHETAMSSPFYTTRPARLQEDRVSWVEMDQDTYSDPAISRLGGIRGCVIRIWKQDLNQSHVTTQRSVDQSLPSRTRDSNSSSVSSPGRELEQVKDEPDSKSVQCVWGVNFSGLICVGNKLMKSLTQNFSFNGLVFRIHSNYFVPRECFVGFSEDLTPPLRFFEIPGVHTDAGKISYDRSALRKMHWTLRALKQRAGANEQFKRDILTRGIDPNTTDMTVPTMTRQTSLRQQIFARQTKLPGTKKEEIGLSVQIEAERLKVATLREEKERFLQELENKREKKRTSCLEYDELNGILMENIHNLSKDKEKLSEWLKTFQDCRESCQKTSRGLTIRRNQLISQLNEIFVIGDSGGSLPTICYVVLPDAESLKEKDDTDNSVALGWSAHLVTMISNLLGVPLRYPINANGSRSSVVDHVLEKIPDKDREFPLFTKGKERVHFDYGVYLLNKNIAQLRWYCGESTQDLRPTLSNLQELLAMCGQPGDKEMTSPSRFKLPSAPPILTGVAQYLSRGTPVHAAGTGSSENASHAALDAETERRRDPREDEPTVDDAKDDVIEVIVKEQSDTSSESSDTNICDKTTNYITVPDLVDKVDNQNGIEIVREVKPVSVEKCSHVRLSSNFSESSRIEICYGTEDLEANPVIENQVINSLDEHKGDSNDNIEEGMEASDLFWGDVSSRAQALSVPSSFRPSKRTFK